MKAGAAISLMENGKMYIGLRIYIKPDQIFKASLSIDFETGGKLLPCNNHKTN